MRVHKPKANYVLGGRKLYSDFDALIKASPMPKVLRGSSGPLMLPNSKGKTGSKQQGSKAMRKAKTRPGRKDKARARAKAAGSASKVGIKVVVPVTAWGVAAEEVATEVTAAAQAPVDGEQSSIDESAGKIRDEAPMPMGSPLTTEALPVEMNPTAALAAIMSAKAAAKAKAGNKPRRVLTQWYIKVLPVEANAKQVLAAAAAANAAAEARAAAEAAEAAARRNEELAS